MMDMRKLANHPALLRYYYDDAKLRKISSRLAEDSFYKEKNPQYIYEDLLCMSDFQIHQLTFQYKVLALTPFSLSLRMYFYLFYCFIFSEYCRFKTAKRIYFEFREICKIR